MEERLKIDPRLKWTYRDVRVRGHLLHEIVARADGWHHVEFEEAIVNLVGVAETEFNGAN
jgi:hypothetical protein